MQSSTNVTGAAAATGDPIGRIPVIEVGPVLAGGAYPAKAVVDELIPITATIFREGHDQLGATVVLSGPDGASFSVPMELVEPKGLDGWEAQVRLPAEGAWTYRIEAWDNPWATWRHDAEIKFAAGQDVELMCTEGRLLLAEGVTDAESAGDHAGADELRRYSEALNPSSPEAMLAAAAADEKLDALMRTHGPRRLVTPTREFPIFVDRKRALFSAWYEFFPRSQGATWNAEREVWLSGTFDGSHERLEAAAAMGFDVVYLPPIHPVGTAFRKGRNNTLTPGPDDVGSPWAIGAPEGGHDAIHPDLGDVAAFERFVAKAGELGLEVALDLALQASPDHPWVVDHREWFTERADGTIAYAENPPKKYQDIYP
ncbi:MAG: DUF3416 domain-containing protein, partial [Propionibacterium sp.]|nr:DUF3416 domain-containing protein [Propionibacterium sp.]